MLLQASLRLAPLVLVFSFACSARVDVDDGNGGSGGDGGGGGGGGNDNPECVPFHDAAPLSAVTIRVRNDSGQDIYLPATCDAVDFSITPEEGEDGVSYGRTSGACFQSCDALQSSDPLLCAADACAPASVRLASGESIDVPWDGRGLISADMPLACWHSKDFGTGCTQVVNASSGDYSVALQAFSECGEGCECDDQGLCFGQASGLEAFPNGATVTLPSQGVVEVVFDICAFGCAEPGDGQG